MTVAAIADTQRLVPLKVKAVLVLIVFGLVALISYGIGTNHGRGGHVLTGRAYVTAYQAGVRTDGWSYGFDVGPNIMTWYDARGTLHQGGMPRCMRHTPTSTWIRFGWTNALGQGGESWRVVTWVQCINRR